MLIIKGQINETHVEASDLINHIEETVYIHGSIYKIRIMSNFSFVLLRSKRDIVQCIYSKGFSKFSLDELKENMNVIMEGYVIKEERSKVGYEVRIIDFKKLSQSYEEYPLVINNKEVDVSLNNLLNYRVITLKNPKERAIFKIQEGLSKGFREFLNTNNFTEIHSPKIVFSGAEGGANIFKLDYFGKEAYLTQSPQFYKQMMVGVFEKVYEIAPVFRAEKHDTNRHVNEYTSVDLEMGFIESFYDIMELETKMLKYAFDLLKNEYSNELKLLNADVPILDEIPCIKFLEAKDLISKTYNRPITDFYDFEPEEEKLICDIMKKETGSEFVFVTHYLSKKRPFYAKDSEEDKEITNSFDLLFRGMEVTTGGQRIHDYEEQVLKMKERSMNVELFESFLMAHKYGLPPHGGLGLGLERLTMMLLGFSNVRRTTLFPRDTIRLKP